MFLEILLFILLGILCGSFTGLCPGVHVNTLCILLLGFSPMLIKYGISPHAIIGLIISMAITHTVVNFIPSILLGCPEGSTSLSVLPGHRMLLAGRGLEAIQLTVIGGIGATILFVLLTPVLLFVLPVLYTAIKHYIHWILLLIVFIMLSTEKNLIKRGWALIIFCLAGLLGLIVLNSALLPPMFVFFPLFTGLFGISTLLISLRLKVKIPQQIGEMKMVDPRLALGGIGKAFCSGMLLGIMPGVGAAQAAVLAQELTRRGGVREFLVSVGGINTAVALFSLISLYTINRARSGAAITVEKIIGNFGFDELILLLGVGLVAVGISAVLTLGMGKKLLGVVEKIPYEKISLGIICFLILLTIAFVGLPGLLVLTVSTAIGLLAPLTGVKRSHCMGVLILPVIIFYSGIS